MSENETRKKAIDSLCIEIIAQSTEQDAESLRERLATISSRWEVVKNEIGERSVR